MNEQMRVRNCPANFLRLYKTHYGRSTIINIKLSLYHHQASVLKTLPHHVGELHVDLGKQS